MLTRQGDRATLASYQSGVGVHLMNESPILWLLALVWSPPLPKKNTWLSSCYCGYMTVFFGFFVHLSFAFWCRSGFIWLKTAVRLRHRLCAGEPKQRDDKMLKAELKNNPHKVHLQELFFPKTSALPLPE